MRAKPLLSFESLSLWVRLYVWILLLLRCCILIVTFLCSLRVVLIGTAVTTFLCVGAAVAIALMTIAAIAPNPGGVGVYLLTNWGIQVSVTCQQSSGSCRLTGIKELVFSHSPHPTTLIHSLSEGWCVMISLFLSCGPVDSLKLSFLYFILICATRLIHTLIPTLSGRFITSYAWWSVCQDWRTRSCGGGRWSRSRSTLYDGITVLPNIFSLMLLSS